MLKFDQWIFAVGQGTMGWRNIRDCPVKARHVRRYCIRLLVSGAFCLAYDASGAEVARYSAGTALAQADGTPNRGATAEMQNIQRLLKLLADRYPSEYASVDPGRIDGSHGAETQDAIRNFKRISGTSAATRNDDQLLANILATLAQMSATQPAEGPEKASPGDNATATATHPPEAESKAAAAISPDSAGTPPAVEPAAATATDTSAAPPRQISESVVQMPPAKPKAQSANRNRNVYFVQAASLKTLEAAKREWRRIFEENRAALKGEQVYFERASIADRGTFFRILIGPMEEQDAAKTLCSFLKQNDQTCVVTARNLADLAKNAAQDGDRASPDSAGPAAADMPHPQSSPVEQRSSTVGKAPEGDNSTGGREIPAGAATDSGAGVTPAESPASGVASIAAPTGTGKENKPSSSVASPPTGAPEPANARNATDSPAAPPLTGNIVQPTVTPGSESDRAKSPSGAAATPDRAGSSDTIATAPPPVALSTEPAKAEAPPTSTRHAAGSAETALLPAEPQSRSGAGAPSTEQTPAPAGTDGNEPVSRPSGIERARAALVNRVRGLGMAGWAAAAAALIAAAAAVFYWRRRRDRRSILSQLFQPANYSFAPVPVSGVGPLGDLETDFESEPLRQSRVVRDEFLRGILGPEAEEQGAARPDDSAMRINSSLKALLVQEPARYKSIFLNWIFLSKVGAALNKKEITIEQLSDRISHEFDLLQTYFKIHLLELDDRHHIRMELPGLFYCLQLSQMKKRQHSAAFSAA